MKWKTNIKRYNNKASVFNTHFNPPDDDLIEFLVHLCALEGTGSVLSVRGRENYKDIEDEEEEDEDSLFYILSLILTLPRSLRRQF